MRDYSSIKSNYRNFSRDVTILVESERLLTASGLEDLRISSTGCFPGGWGCPDCKYSFPPPILIRKTGEPVDWFPDEFGSDSEMMGLIDGLIEKYPQAASLFLKGKTHCRDCCLPDHRCSGR